MGDDKKQVLVIEDEESLVGVIKNKLVKSGFDCVSKLNAREALDYLSQAGDSLPDVIWLDYYLPDMNGLEFMKALRENEKWAEIPVVVVSNSASQEKVSGMTRAGASAYLLKAKYRLEDIVKILLDVVNGKNTNN